jgi:hypothetical protein
MTTGVDEAERARRSEFIRDSRAASQQGETVERRTQRREQKATDWARWFHEKMESRGCVDPVELLPDAFAKLEQMVDDRVAAAIDQIKISLREALTT